MLIKYSAKLYMRLKVPLYIIISLSLNKNREKSITKVYIVGFQKKKPIW